MGVCWSKMKDFWSPKRQKSWPRVRIFDHLWSPKPEKPWVFAPRNAKNPYPNSSFLTFWWPKNLHLCFRMCSQWLFWKMFWRFSDFRPWPIFQKSKKKNFNPKSEMYSLEPTVSSIHWSNKNYMSSSSIVTTVTQKDFLTLKKCQKPSFLLIRRSKMNFFGEFAWRGPPAYIRDF